MGHSGLNSCPSLLIVV
ncbi:hypothetical protein F383_03354 [Gossypium arboreum]|uniref:Uncharacterized protein n=1 Tax=Gossypium arboreum TaxID=29729 RepID=A0A0B0P236_GOSAR|nr:hypothetical protein F383_03354 [Gossypium arboreum]